METDVPDIRSKRDLIELYEAFESIDGPVLHTGFVYIDKYDVVWWGMVEGVSKFDVTPEDIRACIKRVPEEVFPLAPSQITVIHDFDKDIHYLKRPKFSGLNRPEAIKSISQMLIEEAEILEVIAKHPHPNLISYHGCTVKDGRITGIALERHKMMLSHRYEDDSSPVDAKAMMIGIRAGINHIHSLGFAHNDINPMNIALDSADNPVILDFGSCKTIGMHLISCGSPGWTDEEDEEFYISLKVHDDFGIRKLEEWFEKQERERSTKMD